ncbi:MAG: hypothetical protein K2P81_13475 [Bacteriovoracaceae bacterium]|nr:hypothetical protein [Bacteriovoracaceae bacterium]
MRISLLFFIGIIPFFALAQQAESPESNLDLRAGKALFVLEDLDEKEKILLEKTNTGDTYLIYSDEDGSHKSKLARPKADELDQRFSAMFLKVQYELPEDPKGCQADWKLMMRGEEQRVCPKNEQKNQEIKPLFKELKNIVHP